MKQSHALRCEVVELPNYHVCSRLKDTIQARLDKGWTLRAAPVVTTTLGEMVYLIFVRKEAKRSSP